jgi:hypothetical protein
MTVGLARRLLWDGVVTSEEIGRSLHAHVTRKVSFLDALAVERPGILSRIDAELGVPPPSAAGLGLHAGIHGQAPRALWIMLCAAPLGPTADGKGIRVAAPDGGDGHVEAELSHQLGRPVVLVPTSAVTVLSALCASLPQSRPRPSDPPIPLLRVSSDAPGPRTLRGTHAAPSARPSDPVIQLTRTKSLGPPPIVSPGTATANVPPGRSSEESVLDMEGATSADEVASALALGLGSVCRTALVFAVKAGAFEGRAAADETVRGRLRRVTVPSDRPSVLQTAVQAGRYVGPLPSTPVHEALFDLLGSPSGEILVGIVAVSGRPALVYLGAGPDTVYEATRRADQLAEVAGRKLERLLRERKR